MKHQTLNPIAALLTALTIALITGCSATHQGRVAEKSGFLGDYSQMREGTGDEAQLVYLNPKANLSKYDKIILDPIKIYGKVEKSFWRDANQEDIKALVDYFDATIRKNLEDDYTFVAEPGPGVMRFRMAITEAQGANVPMDVVSSILPYGLAISTLKRAAANQASGVGSVCAEMEVVDSQSGERLGAFVDERIGNKFTGKFDKFDQWRAAKGAFDYWATRMKIRMAELRGTAKPE